MVMVMVVWHVECCTTSHAKRHVAKTCVHTVVVGSGISVEAPSIGSPQVGTRRHEHVEAQKCEFCQLLKDSSLLKDPHSDGFRTVRVLCHRGSVHRLVVLIVKLEPHLVFQFTQC